jgi:hypothetical protein
MNKIATPDSTPPAYESVVPKMPVSRVEDAARPAEVGGVCRAIA